MSILIKGMEMPPNCYECWIPCTIEFQDRNYLSRPKCCPCFEIKIPHGGLIDSDKLVELCDIMSGKSDGIGASVWQQFKTTVEWSYKVIPAEEEE